METRWNYWFIHQSNASIDWLIDLSIDWLIDRLVHWLIDWLIDWLVHWFVDWLTCSLIRWLADWLIDWLRNSFLLPHLWCSSLLGVNHDQLVKLAEKEFGSVGFNYSGEIPVVEPCRFTGSEVCSDIIAINLHPQFSLVSVSYLFHFFSVSLFRSKFATTKYRWRMWPLPWRASAGRIPTTSHSWSQTRYAIKIWDIVLYCAFFS